MTEFAGSFTGRIRTLNVISLSDKPQHELQTGEITGPQISTDEAWNAAKVTYWAVTDLVGGHGIQRGYYLNERPNGSRDWGTFEGKATTSQGQTIIEGTWQSTDGTGNFAGIKAQGTFTTRMASATEVQCTWQGRYELAANRRPNAAGPTTRRCSFAPLSLRPATA
jgi:hypothetical protein